MSSKCVPFEHANMAPGWVCCQCKATGPATFNGNNRDACKACGHPRCDATPVRKIPIKEESGLRIVTVKVGSKEKAN